MSAPTQAPVARAQEAADPFRFGWRYVWQKNDQGRTVLVQVPLKYEDVLHPQEEDFIVQNALHDRDCHYLKNALLIALDGREDVAVFQDVRVDWEVEGIEPHGPDLAVFVDVRKQEKQLVGTFRVKEEGARPILVIEVTSPTTRSYDLNDKVMEYHKAGVPFYAIVDYRPELDYREVDILGYRWTPEGFLRVPLDSRGRLWLEPVRLWLAGGGPHAVCFDQQGQQIPEVNEIARGLKKADARVEELQALTEEAIIARREAEKNAADLTSRLAELEAELRRLRGEPGETPPG
jgi:Uma2 family endonuclease